MNILLINHYHSSINYQLNLYIIYQIVLMEALKYNYYSSLTLLLLLIYYY